MMKSRKHVMVLMSTYNGQTFLGEQIDSILGQKGVDVSILVRDDGSTDNTLALLVDYSTKYSNIHVIEGQNVGFAESFMSLVYLCEDKENIDYFAFSDQDDVWLEDKLVSAVTLLEKAAKEDDITLYFSAARAVDRDLNYIFDYCKLNNYEVTKASAIVKCYMLGCTMVFPKSTLRFLCKHKPVQPIMMHDLWINQTCAFFGKIVYDQNPRILYRQHGNNTAGVSNAMLTRIRRTIKTFSSYNKRHFREYNAKCLLMTYKPILSSEDIELLSTAAYYRSSLRKRLKLLFSNRYVMGRLSSNLLLKMRIIFGFF